MSLDNLQELLIHELRDLYSAEQQIARALPKLADGAANGVLAEAFRAHLKETEGQIGRLDRMFEILEVSPRGQKCKGMEGLLEEGAAMLDEPGLDLVRDAGLVGAAQRVEHYEIAAYATARTMARFLGQSEIATLLSESLAEELSTDRTLSDLAEGDVYPKAMLVADPEGLPA